MTDQELTSALYDCAVNAGVPADCSLSVNVGPLGSGFSVYGFLGEGMNKEWFCGQGDTAEDANAKFLALCPKTPAEKIAKLRAEADALESSILASTK
jgi:hypothetical protein